MINNIHSRYTKQLVAHQKILNDFINLYNTNKLHHAYILEGTKGVGKASFAYLLTKLILTSSSNKITGIDQLTNSDNINKIGLIENNTHHNLLIIEPDFDENTGKYKGQINVEKVRNIKQFISLSSFNDDLPKIIIIDSIDNFNINASNAILKILEEPSRDCLFLLINHNSNNILPTIKSRCITKHFNNLNEQELLNIINIKGLYNSLDDLDEIKSYVKLCEGSINNLLWFLETNNHTAYNLTNNIINNKDLTQLDSLLNIVKTFNHDDFKFLINLILYDDNHSIKTSSIRFLHGIEYSFAKIINQSKTFNLDQNTILINLLLALIK
ncbi:hypothetical protein ACFX5K_01850 [Rickettsiales bacterium LUAb2]